jgi:hypothetical protein
MGLFRNQIVGRRRLPFFAGSRAPNELELSRHFSLFRRLGGVRAGREEAR